MRMTIGQLSRPRVQLRIRLEGYNAFHHTQFSTANYNGAIQSGAWRADQRRVRADHRGAESANRAIGRAAVFLPSATLEKNNHDVHKRLLHGRSAGVCSEAERVGGCSPSDVFQIGTRRRSHW